MAKSKKTKMAQLRKAIIMTIRDKIAIIVGGILVGISFGFAVSSLAFPSVEPGTIQIELNITFAGALFGCGIGFILLYAFLPDNKKRVLKFAVAVTAGAAGVYSAFHIGQELRVSTQSERISRSVVLVRKLDGSEITVVRNSVAEAAEFQKMAPEDMYKAIEDNSELSNCVRVVLNQMEIISLCIQAGYADEEYLYKALAHRVPYYRSKLQPFIDGSREKYRDQALYIELEKLVNSWQANRLLYSGRLVPTLLRPN